MELAATAQKAAICMADAVEAQLVKHSYKVDSLSALQPSAAGHSSAKGFMTAPPDELIRAISGLPVAGLCYGDTCGPAADTKRSDAHLK